MKRMRQSSLNTGLDCALKLSYALDPTTPYHNGVVRAMGTAVHKGHEEYYLHRRETGELETDPRPWVEAALKAFQVEVDRAEDRFDWRLEPAKPHLQTPKPEIMLDFESAAKKIAEGLVFYHQNKCYWPERYEGIEAELFFELPWEGQDDWVRHGTIDLVLRDTLDNKVILVDHKTAKGPKKADAYSANKTPQASFYLRSFELLDWSTLDCRGEDLGELHNEFVYDVLSLTHGKPVVFNRFWQPRSKQQIKVVEMQANALIELVDKGGPFLPNTSSFLCSEMYCDFWDICPYGSTLKGQ